jgi:hypothetical protein
MRSATSMSELRGELGGVGAVNKEGGLRTILRVPHAPCVLNVETCRSDTVFSYEKY